MHANGGARPLPEVRAGEGKIIYFVEIINAKRGISQTCLSRASSQVFVRSEPWKGVQPPTNKSNAKWWAGNVRSAPKLKWLSFACANK